ncbi:ferric reductase-like transmembrane domain-containing protein [Patescibacteria group bacterium]|nr:ferric reductase-like transmembrane domain-containing protein [Patescibacteria group bacterium]MBU1721956.1 ferric reductase-like transmembrane domain-containing protein [Patescibacteria group bacterium]MBU1901777.1 ferric reductase-like transmembrane domain-containing protein [Patescibacteria group bacterium]
MFTDLTLTAILYDLGRLTGLIAFFGLGILVFAGDTTRFFDRFFGFDRLIPFLKKLSYGTAVFLLLHPIFFMIAKQKFLAYLIPDFFYLHLALGIVAFYLFIIVMIASALYKRISHLAWQYLHVLNYILFFISLQHAKHWGSSSSYWYISASYQAMLFLIVIGLIYRAQHKIRHKTKAYPIKNIINENHDTKTFVFDMGEKQHFQAGQFCLLRIHDKTRKLHARHPFTMSNAPGSTELAFTIKQSGRFTEALFQLKKGDKVLIEGPFGIFTKKRCTTKRQVFIAGGVGITPFKSMLEDPSTENDPRKIFLFYGARSKKNMLFEDFFSKKLSKKFHAIYCLSQEKKSDGICEIGYIDEKILLKYITSFEETCFYICGPEAMKQSVIGILKKHKVPKEHIIVEHFYW